MTRIRLSFAFLTLCGLCIVLAQIGTTQEKKGPNVQEPSKTDKKSANAKALQDLELASRLIQYGRNNKHAESLLIAAQILHNTPTQKLKAGVKITGEVKGKAPLLAATDDSPKALVAEAKKMSSSPAVESLSVATQKIIDEETRGAAGGPQIDIFTIQPNQSITWDPIKFIGLQSAVVHIDYRVFGSMELEVFDQFGNRVARDNIPDAFLRATWTPAFNGIFTIRLTNRDTIPFSCVLRTN